MDLDRGTLARIDRKLLAEFGQDETFRMVRVPVTPAQWSTWRRYCDASGISMGRAITALIEHELVGVFGESTGDEVPVLSARSEARLAMREARVGEREGEIKAVKERLCEQTERLRHWENRLEARERTIELVSRRAPQLAKPNTKVGRNEPCPCGSGSKYKRCHGG